MPPHHPTLVALTFLAPTTALIAAAVAAPVLLAWYFLKLRRRPVRVSTTAFWQQAARDLQVNAPFKLIRPSWLLALQLLILALLLLAIARPAIDAPIDAAARVVILIDRSGSMNAVDTPDQTPNTDATRLERAKRRAIDLLDDFSPSTEVMAVAFADRAVTVAGLTRDHQRVAAAIDAITPTDQPARLDEALRVVAAFAAGAGSETAPLTPRPPAVLVLSDGHLDTPLTPDLEAALNGAELRFTRIGPDPDAPRDNVGIVAVNARRDLDNPALVRLFARIASTITRETSLTITLALDGEVQRRQAIRLPAAATRRPAELPLTFELVTPNAALATLAINRDDALPADDTAALALPATEGIDIRLVQPDPRGAAGAALEDALASLEPASLRRSTPADYASRAASGARPDADLIVFDRYRPDAAPPVPTLSFGPPPPIPGLGVRAPKSNAAAGVAFWRRAHPVMRYVNLDAVLIAAPPGFALPDQDAANPTTPVTVDTLATGPNGPLIALVRHAGVRRIAVAFDLNDSNWWRDLSFPVFIANAVDALTQAADNTDARAFTTAEPIAITTDAAGQASLRTPEGQTLTVQRADTGAANIGVLERAGLYSLTTAGSNIPVPVNMLNPHESAIGTRDILDVAGRTAAAGDASDLAPKEIWRWLVLAALVLLAAEWALFSARLRV